MRKLFCHINVFIYYIVRVSHKVGKNQVYLVLNHTKCIYFLVIQKNYLHFDTFFEKILEKKNSNFGLNFLIRERLSLTVKEIVHIL
jgi:hypothetical protein